MFPGYLQKHTPRIRQDDRTIGIIGQGRGTGVTHFCILLANYLSGVKRKKTAVLEWNTHHDFEKMTPFDQLISTQSLQILKLLIPYTPPENQRFLAVYTKFLELQHTIDFFQRFHSDVYSQDFEKKTFSPFHIIQEIRPYIPAQFGETFDMLMNMMDMMEVFQNMNETADSAGNTEPDFDPMAMMKNMLAPE